MRERVSVSIQTHQTHKHNAVIYTLPHLYSYTNSAALHSHAYRSHEFGYVLWLAINPHLSALLNISDFRMDGTFQITPQETIGANMSEPHIIVISSTMSDVWYMVSVYHMKWKIIMLCHVRSGHTVLHHYAIWHCMMGEEPTR